MPLDLFPYTVETDDGRHEFARVLEVGDRLLVFTHEGQEPRLVASGQIAGEIDRRRIVRELPTDRGVWAATPQGTCGCRHPLKKVSRSALLAVAGLTVG